LSIRRGSSVKSDTLVTAKLCPVSKGQGFVVEKRGDIRFFTWAIRYLPLYNIAFFNLKLFISNEITTFVPEIAVS
jgi:hypothetical protein